MPRITEHAVAGDTAENNHIQQPKRPVWRILVAGLAGGFVGNGILGAAFSSPWVHGILYDPHLQSALFIDVTSKRDIFVSVCGLVLLSVIHAALYGIFEPTMPGKTWIGKGLFWGLTIWLMYWLFQEWFIYHTLLAEPWLLNFLELAILLAGALCEGLVIAGALALKFGAQVKGGSVNCFPNK